LRSEVSFRERFQYLKNIQGKRFENKLEDSRALISSILECHRRPAIAWSGGKDSTVLLHMILSLKPDINVVWVNTGVEFPECVHFILDLSVRWNLNLHVAKPATTFWKVVDEFGWPMLGKGGNGGWESRAAYLERNGKMRLAKATREARIGAACCRILKKNPSDKIYKELEVDCVVVGNMVAESRQRFLNWAQRGDYYYAPSEGRYKVWPMAAWNDNDVWEYHNRFGIPHSPIYDKGHKRNGCWPCLMDIRFPDSKLSLLRHSHPKLWRFLLVDKRLGERILALKIALGKEEMLNHMVRHYVRTLVEQRPCFFDSC